MRVNFERNPPPIDGVRALLERRRPVNTRHTFDNRQRVLIVSCDLLSYGYVCVRVCLLEISCLLNISENNLIFRDSLTQGSLFDLGLSWQTLYTMTLK